MGRTESVGRAWVSIGAVQQCTGRQRRQMLGEEQKAVAAVCSLYLHKPSKPQQRTSTYPPSAQLATSSAANNAARQTHGRPWHGTRSPTCTLEFPILVLRHGQATFRLRLQIRPRISSYA